METPKVAIRRKRISAPTLWLWEHGHLRGHILDYGCGYGDDMRELCCDGYDPNFRPEGITRSAYDTIICQYVLCVLEKEEDRDAVISRVWDLLKVGGCAFFTVRRDMPRSGTEQTYFVELDLPLLYCRLAQFTIYELRKEGHWPWQHEQQRRNNLL